MPIIFTADTKRFRDFPKFADRLMHNAVKDGTEYGARRMVELVPKGKGTLASAVYHEGPTVIGPSSFTGIVGVNQELAPHAADVNRGTGIDGPFHAPVMIHRPARNRQGTGDHRGSKGGMMRFFKNGEGGGKGIYRKTVKIHPSSKIERGKNYLGKTYDSMIVWTHVRVIEITADVAAYFARK